MKRPIHFSLLLTIAFLTMISFSSEALNSEYFFHMYKYEEEPLVEPAPEIHRMPNRPFLAMISMVNGIEISGIFNNEILSYKAYDENGDRLGVFYDNIEFTHFVLSLNGTIELRIELEDYWLCGYINL